MKRIIFPTIVSLIVLIFFLSYQSGRDIDQKLRVVFCDVGQGDAIYIRTPDDVDILIDGGRDDSVLDCLSRYMPITDRKIELVFATHPDADHIGGLVSVLASYTVESFNSVAVEKDTKVFAELQKVIQDHKIQYKTLSIGDKFSLSDGVTIETLWPEQGFESSDANDHSLVQLLTFGEFDILLTGDVSFEILNSLALDGSNIEIFKLPHHGSKTGVDSSTFDKIDADLAIISAGRRNQYHHPHPSVLNLLNKFGVPYKRTDERGPIEVITDGISTKVVE